MYWYISDICCYVCDVQILTAIHLTIPTRRRYFCYDRRVINIAKVCTKHLLLAFSLTCFAVA